MFAGRDTHIQQLEAEIHLQAGEKTQLRAALVRADGVIEAMSDYIGKMVLRADQLAALNEHWLFMQRLPPSPSILGDPK